MAPRIIAFLIFDDFQILDAAGPIGDGAGPFALTDALLARSPNVSWR
jgi:predicted solute-binding protein